MRILCSVESLSKLKGGECDLKLLVGSERSSKGDGSGNTSSVGKGSTLASYQRSVLVGSSDGRVKIISLLKPIANFYSRTFKPAVEGFGLHKKNVKGTSANLESAREAHVKLGEYIKACESNIRDKFSLQLPGKLNGPHHMISAVTKSTIELASESFKTIQDNVRLVQSLKDKKKVNSDEKLDTSDPDNEIEVERSQFDKIEGSLDKIGGVVEQSDLVDTYDLDKLANLRISELSLYDELPDNLGHMSLVEICDSLSS